MVDVVDVDGGGLPGGPPASESRMTSTMSAPSRSGRESGVGVRCLSSVDVEAGKADTDAERGLGVKSDGGSGGRGFAVGGREAAPSGRS